MNVESIEELMDLITELNARNSILEAKLHDELLGKVELCHQCHQWQQRYTGLLADVKIGAYDIPIEKAETNLKQHDAEVAANAIEEFISLFQEHHPTFFTERASHRPIIMLNNCKDIYVNQLRQKANEPK